MYMKAPVKLERRTLLVLDIHSAALLEVCNMTPAAILLSKKNVAKYPKVTCEYELCLAGVEGIVFLTNIFFCFDQK